MTEEVKDTPISASDKLDLIKYQIDMETCITQVTLLVVILSLIQNTFGIIFCWILIILNLTKTIKISIKVHKTGNIKWFTS